MSRRATRSFVGAVLLMHAGTACISVRRPSFMQPTPERTWPATLAEAQRRAIDGRYESADSLLAQFASRYPEAPQAMETAYWRALVGMDPANPHGSLPTAITFLDAYLAGPRSRDHASEAKALRRVAGQLVEMNKVIAMAQTHDSVEAPSRPMPGEVRVEPPKAAPDANANADEIKRLREELAKANAELERIRKRLAQPPARPPRTR